MSVRYIYPYRDIYQWEFTSFWKPWSVVSKGYKVIDEAIIIDTDGIYSFEAEDDGTVMITIHNSVFKKPDKSNPGKSALDILAVSLNCKNGDIIPVFRAFMACQNRGSWFSGNQMYVKEIIPYLCESIQDFRALANLSSLCIVYINNCFDIQQINLKPDDLIGEIIGL